MSALSRNTCPDDPLIVLTEQRGTCSTKHALLRRLAIEQNLDVALVLGIYEMAEQNTPGVGDILRKYELVLLPEAHCYLRMARRRIDVTREENGKLLHRTNPLRFQFSIVRAGSRLSC